MSELLDLTARSITVMRRMRSAILAGDIEQQEEGFARATTLAQAVGRLLVASLRGEDLAQDTSAVEAHLTTNENQYMAFPAIARTDTDPPEHAHDNARAIQQAVSAINRGITSDSFVGLSGAGLQGRYLDREFTEHPVILAPLSTDLIKAHAINALFEWRFSRAYQIIPAAPDLDGGFAVLPQEMPPMEHPTVYLDGDGTGATFTAVFNAATARTEM